MNSKQLYISLLYLLTMLCLTGDSLRVVPAYLCQATLTRPKYIISAAYDPNCDKVSGTTKICLPPGVANAEELYLRLYPNVFADWKYDKEKMPTKPGWLHISNLRLNGQSISSETIDETLVRVSSIPAEASQTLEMDYELRLPHGGTRLNTFGHTAFLAQWYPMLVMHDQQGWHTEAYTPVGDPFYTEMADYELTLEVPDGYQVISSGVDQLRSSSGIFKIDQENIRDFAAVITRDYKSRVKKCRNTEIRLWYLDGMEDVAEELHKAACSSFLFYSERFGAYPYRELDVVLGETGQGIAGMEYPGLVTSLPRIPGPQGNMPAINVVAHEVAHQWWYGLVGNDQVAEPWLDEGLTSFSEFWYMEKCHGQKSRPLLKQIIDSSNNCHHKTKLTASKQLDKYPEHLYGLMVYLRPTAMMYALLDKYGEEKVVLLLRTYFERYKNKIATANDFKQVANEVLAQDLTMFFKKWLEFE